MLSLSSSQLFMQIFNYKDYYKPEKLNGKPFLLLEYLSGKFENYFGIVELHRLGVPSRFGVNDKTVLVKSLQYYNNQPGGEAYWFYTSDVLKAIADKEKVTP